MNRKEYFCGVREGIPVGLGYLSVSFGFGAMAAAHNFTALSATVMSAANLTSAGQFAGLMLIFVNAGLWEIILSQVVINSRYALMSLALSQRMGQQIGLVQRLLIAYFNTDEIFALAMARKEPLTLPYILGLGLLPFLGWTSGTALGALAGSLLPSNVGTALSVMLYGMFIAVVVPPAKKDKAILTAVVMAAFVSCLFAWVPALQRLESLSIVIITVTVAALCAWLFPVKEEAE